MRGQAPTSRGGKARQARARHAVDLMHEAAAREEEAYFIFHKYDSDGSGTIDESELATCFSEVGFTAARQKTSIEEIQRWDGVLTFNEFVKYYNMYVAEKRRQFDEMYSVGPELGRGSFATVYRAKRLSDGMRVAVKRVSKGGVNVGLLHNEIAIWRMMDHPHLLKLLDVHETEAEMILVTEARRDPPRSAEIRRDDSSRQSQLMEGGDLFMRLSAVKAFTEREAAKLALQVVSAVAYLHESGVVHCDLKPSNILVRAAPGADAPAGAPAAAPAGGESSGTSASPVSSPRGALASPRSASNRRSRRPSLVPEGDALEVRIADFGLSQTLVQATDGDESERAGQLRSVCGTPEYWAPELVALLPAEMGGAGGATHVSGYDSAVDDWAVGCIIYELLAGRPPFRARDESVLYYKISENQIDFDASVFGAIGPAVTELIRQLTRTDPEKRLSCEEALDHPWLAALSADDRVCELSDAPLPDVTGERIHYSSERLTLSLR